MRCISIGSKCNVKFQINKYVKKQETLFFDWLGTDMETVIKILQCKNICDILYHDNIVKDPKNPYTKSNSRIIIKSLPYCVSIHDFTINFKKEDIDSFINKYERRFKRLIELICSTEKLYFIRYEKITEEQKKLFIETILNINPDCDFTLVSVIDDCVNEINKGERFIEFKLIRKFNKYPDDWSTSYLDWNTVFKTIFHLE